MCSCSNKPTQVCAHVLVEWGREIYITCWIGSYTDILTLDNPRTEEAPQRNWVNPGRMSIRGHSAWSSLQLTSYLEEFQRQWVTSRGYQRATSPMAQSVMVKSRQSVHGGGLLSTSSCITHVILGQSSFSPRTHMPPHTHTYTCTYLETLGISTSPVETAHKLLEKSLTGRLTHFLGIPED